MDAQELVNEEIGQLGLSNKFVEDSHAMQFHTIGDILRAGSQALVKREGFNYDWLAELTEFLEAHQMLQLLQPLPGRSRG